MTQVYFISTVEVKAGAAGRAEIGQAPSRPPRSLRFGGESHQQREMRPSAMNI